MGKQRFFTPDINKWKYVDSDKPTNNQQVLGASNISSRGGKITEREKDKLIRSNVKFVDWSLSFSKNCIQLSFIIFLIANIFVIVGLSLNYFQMGALMYFDTYITEVYGMMRDVIGVYIIKTCLENSFKITMSVVSDYIDKKYGESDNNNYNEDPKYPYSEFSYEEMAAAELVGANIAGSNYNEDEDFERVATQNNIDDELDDNGIDYIPLDDIDDDKELEGE